MYVGFLNFLHSFFYFCYFLLLLTSSHFLSFPVTFGVWGSVHLWKGQTWIFQWLLKFTFICDHFAGVAQKMEIRFLLHQSPGVRCQVSDPSLKLIWKTVWKKYLNWIPGRHCSLSQQPIWSTWGCITSTAFSRWGLWKRIIFCKCLLDSYLHFPKRFEIESREGSAVVHKELFCKSSLTAESFSLIISWDIL